MNTLDYDLVLSWVEDVGGCDEENIYPRYQGRGMNDHCLGITFEYLPDFVEFVLAAANEPADSDWLPHVCTDQMGRSTIYYWPNTTIINLED